MSARWQARLPFYYGWIVVAVAFMNMGVAVSARTAFSLLLPPLIEEFGWERGLVAGAFSFGFLITALLSPFIGRAMDRHGPRGVIGCGIVLAGAGLLSAPAIAAPWQLYATLGVLVGVGTNFMTFTAQSIYLPHWFVRRRGLAIGIAFTGVGVGAIVLMPWLQTVIDAEGWRAAARLMGLLLILLLGPLTLLLHHGPQALGLRPDGDARPAEDAPAPRSAVVDTAWAAVEWTLARAVRTRRFWWIVLGYFGALFAWYGVQIHQTQYLIEVGFTPLIAAWALGIVSAVAIPGQILFGWLSDRIGREAVWAIGCLGFVLCYVALIALESGPSTTLLWLMVLVQGPIGYAMTSVMGPITAEIFEGPHYGAIFGTLTIALVLGGATGPWVTGVVHDLTGSYRPAFLLGILCCVVSAAAIWIAAPRRVRVVPGRIGGAQD